LEKPTTAQQYAHELAQCKALFIKKQRDYGSAWRILRPSSLTDQLYIKAKRIRSIEEKQTQKVGESIAGEYLALVNYSFMALIQLELPLSAGLYLSTEQVEALYQEQADRCQDLMLRKNHDYGEAWRDMRLSSLTDLILMKLLRTKEIEDHKEQLLVSEGLDANYQDIANYALFALIRLREEEVE